MPEVRRITTRAASTDLLRSIRTLLEQAFPGDFSDEDWEHARGGWHVLALDDSVDGAVLAHAAVVDRRLEIAGQPRRAGYVEAVATAPDHEGQGLGSVVMAATADLVRAEFELGALSTARHSFYERLGWEQWQGPTFVRRGSELVRSPEDDDGVMVLRFGPSVGLDLAAPIACEERAGDDW